MSLALNRPGRGVHRLFTFLPLDIFIFLCYNISVIKGSGNPPTAESENKMVAKQVIFRDAFDAEDYNCSPPLGGIAIYEDYFQGTDAPFLELKGVICGECGGWIDAEDVEIISTLDQWWSLDEAIKDNFSPDGTRGFRPEDQIRMELD